MKINGCWTEYTHKGLTRRDSTKYWQNVIKTPKFQNWLKQSKNKDQRYRDLSDECLIAIYMMRQPADAQFYGDANYIDDPDYDYFYNSMSKRLVLKHLWSKAHDKRITTAPLIIEESFKAALEAGDEASIRFIQKQLKSRSCLSRVLRQTNNVKMRATLKDILPADANKNTSVSTKATTTKALSKPPVKQQKKTIRPKKPAKPLAASAGDTPLTRSQQPSRKKET